jgi:hypothetical protein
MHLIHRSTRNSVAAYFAKQMNPGVHKQTTRKLGDKIGVPYMLFPQFKVGFAAKGIVIDRF